MFEAVSDLLAARVRPPVGIVLGSPREAAELVGCVGGDALCFQFDLHQAGRVREELATRDLSAKVKAAADLWDLTPPFQTLLFPAQRGGERILKIDMIEQAYHALRPRGALIVLTPYDVDPFFPAALKKVFGKVHAPGAGEGRVLICHREGERPRRRHEVTFHVRLDEQQSLRFVSRPGTFSYGSFDDGARALVETAELKPGDRILDLGCGCGTNGVYAARQLGGQASVTFVDSNVRAVALAELNARENGLTDFRVRATSTCEGLPDAGFDVVLANPPYYAAGAIAQAFIDQSRRLLRPGGRFYLVTKQPDLVGPQVAEAFGLTEPVLRRGYTVLANVIEE